MIFKTFCDFVRDYTKNRYGIEHYYGEHGFYIEIDGNFRNRIRILLDEALVNNFTDMAAKRFDINDPEVFSKIKDYIDLRHSEIKTNE